LFLICIRVQVLVDADPATLCGWECLIVSFGSSIRSIQDVPQRFSEGQFVYAARELLALVIFAAFCCSTATVLKWIQSELGNRNRFVASIIFMAIVLATPATWAVPLLFGQVSIGYFLWAVSVNTCFLATVKTTGIFYVLFFVTCTVLLAIRFLGFPTNM